MKLLRTAIQMAWLTALFAALTLNAGLPIVGQSADGVPAACTSCPGSEAKLAPADDCGMSQCGCCVSPSRENSAPPAPFANLSTPSVRVDLSVAQVFVVLPSVAESTGARFFSRVTEPHSATPLYLTYSVFLI